MVLINYQIINDLIKLLSFYQAQDVLEILYVIKYSELYPLLSPIVIQLVHQLVGIYPSDDILDRLNVMECYTISNNPSQGQYFSMVRNYTPHNNLPSTAGIYTYSFALRPENWQPSCTCNLTRLDNYSLQLSTRDRTIYKRHWIYKNIYKNYDPLRGDIDWIDIYR